MISAFYSWTGRTPRRSCSRLKQRKVERVEACSTRTAWTTWWNQTLKEQTMRTSEDKHVFRSASSFAWERMSFWVSSWMYLTLSFHNIFYKGLVLSQATIPLWKLCYAWLRTWTVPACHSCLHTTKVKLDHQTFRKSNSSSIACNILQFHFHRQQAFILPRISVARSPFALRTEWRYVRYVAVLSNEIELKGLKMEIKIAALKIAEGWRCMKIAVWIAVWSRSWTHSHLCWSSPWKGRVALGLWKVEKPMGSTPCDSEGSWRPCELRLVSWDMMRVKRDWMATWWNHWRLWFVWWIVELHTSANHCMRARSNVMVSFPWSVSFLFDSLPFLLSFWLCLKYLHSSHEL